MLFTTDGGSNINRDLTIPTADQVHDRGITVFTIAVGLSNPAWEDELNGLASGPASEHRFSVLAFSDLSFRDSTLVAKTCREPPAGEFLSTNFVIIIIFYLM